MQVFHELGHHGELLARRYLEKQGYFILETNWRFGKLEVDIICEIEDYIVFVEVKTRSSLEYGAPEDAVDQAKINHLIEAADAFLSRIDTQLHFRFDILSIIMTPEKSSIRHIQEAFIPGQTYLI